MVYLVLILTSVLWGLAPLAIKISLRDLPPFTLSFFRFLVACLFFLLVIFFQKRIHLSLWEILKIILVALFLCGNMLFFVYGIQYTTTVTGSLIYTVTPILSALGGYLLYKEKINFWQTLGVILAFSGLLLVIFSPLIEKGETWQVGSLYGNFFVTLAAISFTVYSLGSKPLSKRYSPLLLSTIASLVSLVIFLFLALIEYRQAGGVLTPPKTETITAIIYLSLGATVATLFLFQWVIKETNAFIANLMAYIQPLTTGFAGYFFLGEKVTPIFIFGSALVFLGVFIATNVSYLVNSRGR